jgi:hypothetical protein
MNTFRVLYAIALWTIASVAAAAPITYNATISGSFEVDNDLVLDIDLIINGYSYSASEVEFYKDSWMLGASLCAFNCMNAVTNDFLLEFDPNNLMFYGFTYTVPYINDIWYSSTGSVTVANVHVPEPGSFLLLILGLCGLLVRFAKLRQ